MGYSVQCSMPLDGTEKSTVERHLKEPRLTFPFTGDSKIFVRFSLYDRNSKETSFLSICFNAGREETFTAWMSPGLSSQSLLEKIVNMAQSTHMTNAQKNDLLIEWNLYSANQQEPILAEFHKKHKGDYNQNDFLEYLRKKLEIDGYWKKAGIS